MASRAEKYDIDTEEVEDYNITEQDPKILFYDIETSPIIGYTWTTWNTNVIKVKEDWQILTVAWKWLGESKVHVLGQDDFPDYVPGVNNDRNLVRKIRELYDEANIVVAHNGNQFDQRKVTARMIVHGFKPPSPYFQIDTKRAYQSAAAFTSNRLKNLAEQLETDNQKGDPGGFETWEGCLAGDVKSWKKMKKYNKGDITTLEDLYIIIRPWIKNHPNIARLANRFDGCPKCGSTNIQHRGYRQTSVNLYRQAYCNDCGGWSRLRIPFKEADGALKPKYVNS